MFGEADPPIDGTPTLLCIPLFFFPLDSLETAEFLTEYEKMMAVELIQERNTTARSKVNWTIYLRGVADWKAWVHAFIQLGWNYIFASLLNFVPTIIKNLGFTSVKVQNIEYSVILWCVIVYDCSCFHQ